MYPFSFCSSCDALGRQQWRILCGEWMDHHEDLPLQYGVFISTNDSKTAVKSLQLTALQLSPLQNIFVPRGIHQITFRIQDQLGLYAETSKLVCWLLF